MATLVAFHAHPDDECITTGGTLSRAVDHGQVRGFEPDGLVLLRLIEAFALFDPSVPGQRHDRTSGHLVCWARFVLVLD